MLTRARNKTRRNRVSNTSRMAAAHADEPKQTARARGMRSLWRGAISFGMVAIPVRLYPAVSSKDLAFNLLHEKCNTRIKQIKWCPKCKREIEWDETIKGYEYSDERYVRLTDEDFESVPVPSKHTISLTSFVNHMEIDPIYYEKTYYLEPEAVGEKPFALLWQALTLQKLTGVAKVAIREKERLCALRPREGALVLETMYYPDEIRETLGVVSDVHVSPKELELATQIIEHLSDKFRPEQYHDEYREALMERIQAKAQGDEIVIAAEPERDDKVIDLMAALRQTLETTRAEKVRESRSGRTKVQERLKAA